VIMRDVHNGAERLINPVQRVTLRKDFRNINPGISRMLMSGMSEP